SFHPVPANPLAGDTQSLVLEAEVIGVGEPVVGGGLNQVQPLARAPHVGRAFEAAGEKTRKIRSLRKRFEWHLLFHRIGRGEARGAQGTMTASPRRAGAGRCRFGLPLDGKLMVVISGA